MADKTQTRYAILAVEEERGRHVARIYSPPNAARRDWEFGRESYVEALTTALNSLAESGWAIAGTEVRDSGTIYILVAG